MSNSAGAPSAKYIKLRLAVAISILSALFVFVAYQAYLLPQPIRAEPSGILIKPFVQIGRTGDMRDLEIVWGSEGNSDWKLLSSIAPGIWLESDPIVAETV